MVGAMADNGLLARLSYPPSGLQGENSMNWDAIGALGEVVGAVAVVATLIYLARQIRQNNELLSSGSRQALVANDVTSLATNIAHASVFAKFASGQALSAEDQLSMSFMFALDLRNREFEYFQYQNGLLDEQTWLSYREVLLINHSSPRGRRWWERVGKRIVDPAFAAEVDGMLETDEVDATYQQMMSWADESGS